MVCCLLKITLECHKLVSSVGKILYKLVAYHTHIKLSCSKQHKLVSSMGKVFTSLLFNLLTSNHLALQKGFIFQHLLVFSSITHEMSHFSSPIYSKMLIPKRTYYTSQQKFKIHITEAKTC